ncbi:rod shape-determining protein MreC [Dethiosulfovibrio salsuginis]|uniref:Cell shape-determining protein MreC n=1 Tax=Dethiosulfovibrio salsuginis TaxID=561720 RepID=A0A1X7J9E3_9BACT|nr:rod shape-determining protein MreC [Dethiosulfovibrio salsuginis]SMG24433.1 rod shape-determining protein MreC [Dethiosulfovibrio salsuginis]
MENRQPQIISGLCAVALGLLLTLSTGSETIVKLMGQIGGILEFIERPGIFIRETYIGAQGWIKERDHVLAHLEKLERENDGLFLALHMKEALDVRESVLSSTKDSMVDLRLPLSWWDRLRINKGGIDGVSPGDPVLQDGFLIGRVASVETSRSWVSLISSTGEMIPVVIRETRDVGVITGDGTGSLWLRYIPDGSQIKEGMTLDTALIGESIPAGIPVGSLSGVTRESDHGITEYKVIPGGSLSRIYGVRVFRRESDE